MRKYVILMDEISLMLKVLNEFFPSMGTHGEDEYRTLSTGLMKTNSTYIVFVEVQKTYNFRVDEGVGARSTSQDDGAGSCKM